MKPLRVAMYVHSLNPRGGVVHALSIAEAIQSLGHHVEIVAPAAPGQRLFRSTTAPIRVFPAGPVTGDLRSLIRQRVPEYIAAIRSRGNAFDIHHAHDGMSGFALAQLRGAGEIAAMARTVHHLDQFDDRYLTDAQDESVRAADLLFCVSRLWAHRLGADYQREAVIVHNGVDMRRFSPKPLDDDCSRCESVAGRLTGPTFLAVGGVERRKNTLAILQAFSLASATLPSSARLIIAGGASLLDHSVYRRDFDACLESLPNKESVRIIGPVEDDTLPPLYRRATALVFPSLVEGFGLAVLEAMASGTPVIASRLPPFTEYLCDTDALLVDPLNPQEIAAAMTLLCDSPAAAADYRSRGLAVAARFSWQTSAAQHLDAYTRLVSGGENARNAICSSLAG